MYHSEKIHWILTIAILIAFGVFVDRDNKGDKGIVASIPDVSFVSGQLDDFAQRSAALEKRLDDRSEGFLKAMDLEASTVDYLAKRQEDLDARVNSLVVFVNQHTHGLAAHNQQGDPVIITDAILSPEKTPDKPVNATVTNKKQ